jgi:hypothetical protein
VLGDLYRAVSGHAPRAVRAYNDEDALLLLLRFEHGALAGEQGDALAPPLEAAFLAMPSMVATAVRTRAGRSLAPGNVSVCVERGLAVFAFTTVEPDADRGLDEELFRIDAELAGPFASLQRPALRLAG